MDQEKIGNFIADLRKEKGLTQKELAHKLNVTDKAISKWETGRCMPDYSLMEPLCKILGISLNELLQGEKIKPDLLVSVTDKNIKMTIKKIINLKNLVRSLISGLILIGVVFISIFTFNKLNPPGDILNTATHITFSKNHSDTDTINAIHTYELYFQKKYRNYSLKDVYYDNACLTLEDKWSARKDYDDIIILAASYQKRTKNMYSYFVLGRKDGNDWQVVDKFNNSKK